MSPAVLGSTPILIVGPPKIDTVDPRIETPAPIAPPEPGVPTIILSLKVTSFSICVNEAEVPTIV